jgi:glycosyltransferase involved in cell wall biosynthesis
MPTVSIVIPTYNRLDRLQRVLACLEAQDFPRSGFEIVVVADGCNDGTGEYLASIAEGPLRVLPVVTANQGPAAARNRGVAEASGRLLLFLDDDVTPEPQLISEHVRAHERLSAGAAGQIAVLGPMVTPTDTPLLPWVRWEQVRLERQYGDMVAGRWQATARQFYTGNTSIEREAVLAAGGFDTRFRRAEDVELAYRLAANGVRFVFNPRAVGYHYAERSYRSWMNAAYAYGRADVVFSRDLGQSWLLPRLAYEFRGNRHPLIRAVVNVCLGRPTLSRVALAAMRLAAHTGGRLGSERAADLACSGIFNLRHYQGIADELGGRAAFFSNMGAAAGARAAAAPAPGVFEDDASLVSDGLMAGQAK